MSSSLLAAIAIVSLLVLASVLIYYEMLYRLSNWMPETTSRHRYRAVVGVLWALLAHVIEVWLFAFGYYNTHAPVKPVLGWLRCGTASRLGFPRPGLGQPPVDSSRYGLGATILTS